MLTVRSIVDGRVEMLATEQCVGRKGQDSRDVLWIHAVGDGPDVHEALRGFGIEEWIVEDMMESSTHPKAEAWPGALFLVVFGVDAKADEDRFLLRTAEVDAVLGDGWLVTHTSQPLQVIDRVAQQVDRDPREAATAGELLHLILDRVVDGYEPFIEKFIPDAINDMEDDLFSGTADATVRREIYLRRRDIQQLQRVAAPQAAAVRRVATMTEAAGIGRPHLFIDIADRLSYVAAQIESLRSQLNAAFDHYQSQVAHTQNEVMKVLTMVSATLLPITVVAGIYGMNFRYMPELNERWGYPFALTLSALIVVANVLYFRAKGWIGRSARPHREVRKLEINPGVVLQLPAMGARTLASGTKRLVRWSLSR